MQNTLGACVFTTSLLPAPPRPPPPLLLLLFRWTTMGPQLIAPKEAAGAQNALLHMVFSPLYMQRLQPEGTPGLKGQWDGKPLWPGVDAVVEKMNQRKGMAVDFAAVQKLFKPKFDAWRAARGSKGSKKAQQMASTITFDQVLSKVDKVLVPRQT